MLLHQKAAAILVRKQAAESTVKIMTELMAQDPSSSLIGYYQEAGDRATGESMALQVMYFDTLRQINDPILFKEARQANAAPAGKADTSMVRELLTVVDLAEEHAKQN